MLLTPHRQGLHTVTHREQRGLGTGCIGGLGIDQAGVVVGTEGSGHMRDRVEALLMDWMWAGREKRHED